MVSTSKDSSPPTCSNISRNLSNLHVVFYANASSTIGAGHVMRLLAIAQTFINRGIKVTFASCECPDYLQDRLQQEGFEFVLLADALLVNVDDDTHQQPLLSSIIITPSASASKQRYKKRAPGAMLCLGPEFTLLRQEFMQQAYTNLNQRKKILITLGGADVKNMSYVLALSLLKRVSNSTQIQVLLGGLHSSGAKALQELRQQYSNLHIVEQSQNVAQIMMQSGLAISAAGGTLGELASMGTPAIALVSADNQQAVFTSPHADTWYSVVDVRQYNGHSDSNNIVSLNTHFNTQLIEKITTQADELWRDLCKRERMSNQARQLIDGLGCRRIVEHVLSAL
jgi:UDP-2,4-diacetamido-2,4,6-trideoxy-beta-L-altropyranose hydrolase